MKLSRNARPPRVPARRRLSLTLPVAMLPALAMLGAGLAGCSYVSKDGPYSGEVRDRAQVSLAPTSEQLAYALVAINPLTLAAANQSTSAGTPAFGAMAVNARRATDVPIAVGDVVALTVFEASSGGLFIPQEAGSRNGNFVSTPNQQVDSSGSIDVPYAGTLRVAGMTPRAAANIIQGRLKNRAIEPQVVVTVVEHHGSEISVLGEVSEGTRFSVDPGGIRVLDAIARAKGPKYPPYETMVTVQRAGRTDAALMTSIVKNPAQNVELRPGDVVYLSHEQKVFMAFGATPPPGAVGGINSRRFVFDNDNVTLAEGMAKAGGLSPDRADPSAVFLYRLEPRTTLVKMGVDVSRFAQPLVPTVYTLDMSRPDSFFLANNLYMRHRDLIFVSESPQADVNKFTSAIRGFTGTFSEVGTGVYYGLR